MKVPLFRAFFWGIQLFPMSSGSKMTGCLIWREFLNMTRKMLWSVPFLKVGLHMHTVPQNKDKFAINNLSYCCKALTFTHSLVYEFLCVQF